MCAPFLTVEQVDFSGSVVASTSTSNPSIVFASISLSSSTEIIRVTIKRNSEDGDVCGSFEFVNSENGWVCTNKSVDSVFILTEGELADINDTQFGVQRMLSNL